MKVSDVLDKAADLIEPEGRWLQGPWAVDADGNEVNPRDEAACAFCASGALERIAGGCWDHPLYRAARDVVDPLTLEESLVCFNDLTSRTQPEVVAKLREAANVARERGL
jgi:hypothetical protein